MIPLLLIQVGTATQIVTSSAEPIYQGGATVVRARPKRRPRVRRPVFIEIASMDERDIADLLDVLEALDAA